MERIKQLIIRQLRGEITPAEQAELAAWADSDPEHQALLAEFQDPERLEIALAEVQLLEREGAEERVWERVSRFAAREREVGLGNQPARGGARVIRRLSIAAAVMALLGSGAWWVWQGRTVRPVPPPALAASDVAAPTSNRATLTLAGGETVQLDSVGAGVLAEQGSAKIERRSNGQLSYQTSAATLSHNELLYNTLVNPRGSKVIQVTLSDGTTVWLNAESSLRYPVIFGPERTVDISGEAYFEVAADAHKPFRVKRGETSIDVLGTSFNVNAYTDEPALRVTLAQGKVRVQDGDGLVLHAGQQARVAAGKVTLAKEVDMETELAWKNGRFAFVDADLPTVMRELGRWYDVDVHFVGPVPDRRFNGRIGQSLTLSQVLRGLDKERIHYTIQGKIVTVQP